MKLGRHIVSALTAMGMLTACGGSDSDDPTDIVEDFTNGTANLESLGLDEALNAEVPDELGDSDDSSSLALLANRSREQCHLRNITTRAVQEMHRVSGIVCHLGQQSEITIPDTGEDGNVYKITFEKDPAPKEEGTSSTEEEAELALMPKPRVIMLHISQPEEGSVRLDICDPKGPKQVITMDTDETVRSGSMKFHGKDPFGTTRAAGMKFAIDLETGHLKLQSFEHLTNADAEEVRRYLRMSIPAEESQDTVPHFLAFSSFGTWNERYEHRFGAARLLGGFGEALLGEIAEGDETTDAVFRLARFKTAGTSVDQDELPDPEDMENGPADIPSELSENDDEAEPENNACDATEFTEITIGQGTVEDRTACERTEFKRDDCQGTGFEPAEALAADAVDITKRKRPDEIGDPELDD